MKSIWFCREYRTKAIVEIAFASGWNSPTVSWQGEVLGTLTDRSAIEKGHPFSTPDGSILNVRLPSGRLIPEVLLDGKRMLLSAGDPVRVVRNAAGLIAIIGAINLILGAWSLASDGDLMNATNATAFLYGAVFLVLTFFVWRGSLLALFFAAILLAASIGLYVYFSSRDGVRLQTGGVILRCGMLLYLMWMLNIAWGATPRDDGQSKKSSPGVAP